MRNISGRRLWAVFGVGREVRVVERTGRFGWQVSVRYTLSTAVKTPGPLSPVPCPQAATGSACGYVATSSVALTQQVNAVC